MTSWNRYQTFLTHPAWCLVLVILPLIGCAGSATDTLSYADALAIFNEETRTLDRLKDIRAKLQQELDTPLPTSLLDSAEQILGDTSKLSDQLSGVLEDLSAVENSPESETAQEHKENLIGTVKEQIEQAKAKNGQNSEQRTARVKEITTKIAELDKQIADQQLLVDRAFKDKEAAAEARK